MAREEKELAKMVACKWILWRDMELGRAGIVVLCRNNYYLACLALCDSL